MIVNGWRLYFFRPFAEALSELEQEVAALARRDKAGYKSHPKTKLLASVYKAVTQTVPANPDHPDFRLGKTLAPEYAHWRRVMKGMPDRYRLFFRFVSRPVKLIVYVWFNDDNTLRKAGSKTDVYEAFKRMLARGIVPATIEDLLRESTQSTGEDNLTPSRVEEGPGILGYSRPRIPIERMHGGLGMKKAGKRARR